MPRKYRAVLVLCYLKARTHDQAAEELRCPVGTVRSRLAWGRDLLKRRLTQRGHAPQSAAILAGTAMPARYSPRPSLRRFYPRRSGRRPISLFSSPARSPFRHYSYPRSTDYHETRATEMDRTDRPCNRSLGRRSRRRLRRRSDSGLARSCQFESCGGSKSTPPQASGQEIINELPQTDPAEEVTEERLKALESELDQLLP